MENRDHREKYLCDSETRCVGATQICSLRIVRLCLSSENIHVLILLSNYSLVSIQLLLSTSLLLYILQYLFSKDYIIQKIAHFLLIECY